MKHLSIILLVFVLLYACSDNVTESTKPAEDIDNLIRNAGIINESVVEKNEKINERTLKVEENDKKWNVKETTWSLAKNLDKNIIPFNPNANTLWPGALVQGKDVPDGILNSLGDNLPRTSITITAKSGDKLFGSEEIDKPSNATTSQALSDILKGVSGNTTANMIFKQKISYSREQACMELGLSAKWLMGTGFESSFSTEHNSERKDIFIFFKQAYYTVSVNEPSRPSDYFGNDISIEDLEYKVNSNNPLCYVASVTYGRLLIVRMTYRGEKSAKDVEAALTGAFSGIISGGGGYSSNKIIEESEFSGIILGGSAGGAAKALTGSSVQSVLSFINEEANYSSASPGYPISYTVKNLADNSIVKLGETTEFTEREYSISYEDYCSFNFIFSHFDVIDDGNMFVDGDFFYKIEIQDNKGNTLLDVNGDLAKIETKRNESQKAGSGERLEIVKQIYGVLLKKDYGVQFSVFVTVWDKFSSGNDKQAVCSGIKYPYPWNNIPTEWYTLDMSTDDYDIDLIYRIEVQ